MAATTPKSPPHILAVRASAGAGKTYQLTLRFLELLRKTASDGAGRPAHQALRQIVAITFTNRAAAEMKDRIILALKYIALETDQGKELAAKTRLRPADAAAWLDLIPDHFGDLQVRTIDSLIYSVMRAFAIEMGLPPELDVDFDRDTQLDRCFDKLLASIVWENPNDPRRKIILGLIEAYLDVDQGGGVLVERAIREHARELYDLAADAKNERAKPDLASARAALEAKGRALLAGMQKHGFLDCARRAGDIERYVGAPRDHLGASIWETESLGECIKKAETLEAKKLKDLDRLFIDLKTARQAYLESHSKAKIHPYLLVLDELRKEVRCQAETEGVIIGGDWRDRAHDYLTHGEAPGAYAFLKLGSAVRHFLIDEFQDTSRRQWETLQVLVEECLANGGTLFYVGDVKQAIYGWRGGDWRLFQKVFDKDFPSVEAASRREQALDTNYRSLPAIVEFNNRLYATLLDPVLVRTLATRMMPKDTPEEKCEELAATLVSNFKDVAQKVAPGRARAGGASAAGSEVVRVRQFAGRAADLDLAIEQALRPEIRDAWQRRRGGIAVLVRSNKQAETVAAWLVAEGIPIVTESSLRLKSSPLIKGLVAFLHFLEYPLDDMAFWGALASPLFQDLPDLAGEKIEAFLREGGWPRPLYRAFEKAFPRPAKRLVRSLLARSGFLAPYDLAREMLAAFEVQERYPDDAVFLNRFLEIVFQAEAAGTMSLSGFLQFWDEGGMEEQIGLPEDVPAVRILTIHKAKGLEFPVVFVPFTNWKRGADRLALTDDSQLVWLTGSSKVPLPAPLARLRLRTTIEDVIENVNLLYVATTRARQELYIYVTCTLAQGNKPNSQYLAAWLAEMLAGAGLLVEAPEPDRSPR